MVVKINGQVVGQKTVVAEAAAKPHPPKKQGSVTTKVAVVAALAAFVITEPSIVHAAAGAVVTQQETDANAFQDFVIKSLTVDVSIAAILFAFKRQWAKTFSWASGIVYGGYFCAQTIGMMLAVFFTWMNHILQHWLDIVRMG